MTDETPKQPDEKDDTMNEDDHDPHVPEVTRREAMSGPAKAAVGGVGVLGLLGLSTGSASAQQSLEPAQVLRDSQDREIRLRMLDGDLLLEHVPSGATFSYDQSAGSWVLNGTLDAGENDIQNVGSLDAESVSTDELNNVVYISPDASDWGTAVNNALPNIDPGGTIMVPPANWTTDTTAVLDKDCRILSHSYGSMSFDGGIQPTIQRTSDVPIIETGDNIETEIVGLNLEAPQASPGTADGIIVHGTTHVEGVRGQFLGGDLLVLEQAASADNLNKSRAVGMVGRNLGGSVIRQVNNSGNAPDVNAQKFDVKSSLNNGGWAINLQDGFGNSLEVQHAEGGEHTGAIQIGGSRNHATITYIEGNVNQGIVFNDEQNSGEIVFSGLSEANSFIDNSTNNKKAWHGHPARPDEDKSGALYTIAPRLDVGGGEVILSSGGARIKVSGGEVYAEDDSGNETQLS